jgi:hypothetical protein
MYHTIYLLSALVFDIVLGGLEPDDAVVVAGVHCLARLVFNALLHLQLKFPVASTYLKSL